MWLEIVCGIVACDALVHLWLEAAPLQGQREWLTENTPSLYSKRKEKHLMDCADCLSVWFAFFLVYTMYVNIALYIPMVVILSIYRGSNYARIWYCLSNDRQIDIMVERRKQLKKG
jgi:hypothetical protein